MKDIFKTDMLTFLKKKYFYCVPVVHEVAEAILVVSFPFMIIKHFKKQIGFKHICNILLPFILQLRANGKQHNLNAEDSH